MSDQWLSEGDIESWWVNESVGLIERVRKKERESESKGLVVEWSSVTVIKVSSDQVIK